MSLPIKKTINAQEALEHWSKHNEKIGKPPPKQQYVSRYCHRYEGIMCYRDSDNRWRIYVDVFQEFLEHGFPDILTRQPIMTLAVGLRYIHKNGLKNYTLRELRKDLDERKMIIKHKTNRKADQVTRSNLNKLLREWFIDG